MRRHRHQWCTAALLVAGLLQPVAAFLYVAPSITVGAKPGHGVCWGLRLAMGYAWITQSRSSLHCAQIAVGFLRGKQHYTDYMEMYATVEYQPQWFAILRNTAIPVGGTIGFGGSIMENRDAEYWYVKARPHVAISAGSIPGLTMRYVLKVPEKSKLAGLYWGGAVTVPVPVETP